MKKLLKQTLEVILIIVGFSYAGYVFYINYPRQNSPADEKITVEIDSSNYEFEVIHYEIDSVYPDSLIDKD
jgi:hypothetical protein